MEEPNIASTEESPEGDAHASMKKKKRTTTGETAQGRCDLLGCGTDLWGCFSWSALVCLLTAVWLLPLSGCGPKDPCAVLSASYSANHQEFLRVREEVIEVTAPDDAQEKATHRASYDLGWNLPSDPEVMAKLLETMEKPSAKEMSVDYLAMIMQGKFSDAEIEQAKALNIELIDAFNRVLKSKIELADNGCSAVDQVPSD